MIDELMLEMIDTMDDQVEQEAEDIMDAEDDLVYGDSDGDIIDIVKGGKSEDDSLHDDEDEDLHVVLDYDSEDDEDDHECDDDDCCDEDDEYIKNGICPKCGHMLIDCECDDEDDDDEDDEDEDDD